MFPKSKEEAVATARAKAQENMAKFISCAYSTVLALQDTFELNDDALLKASGAMTGGIGGRSDVCGSMIGACLMLGSVCGRGHEDGEDEAGKAKLFESSRQAADYYDWFQKANGTVNCREIVTRFGNGTFYDFGIPEQARLAFETGVAQKCVEHVQNNVAEAAGRLWDELHKEK